MNSKNFALKVNIELNVTQNKATYTIGETVFAHLVFFFQHLLGHLHGILFEGADITIGGASTSMGGGGAGTPLNRLKI